MRMYTDENGEQEYRVSYAKPHKNVYLVKFNVKDDKLEEVDIKPRIFAWEEDENGIANLIFPEYLKSQRLIETFYQTYQDTIRRPVEIEALVRLSELDLAGLDFSRAVYLGQTGQYYAVKKVQTSDSDLCKVELIQLA